MATQEEHNAQTNWTIGFNLYMDNCPRTMCINIQQEKGWDYASWAEDSLARIEAAEHANEEEVYVI